MKRKARLENWSIVNLVNPFDPFSKESPRIILGSVFGHGGFEDGESITTSMVENLDIAAGLAETVNTQYDLGKINQDFKAFLVSTKEVVDRFPDLVTLQNL